MACPCREKSLKNLHNICLQPSGARRRLQNACRYMMTEIADIWDLPHPSHVREGKSTVYKADYSSPALDLLHRPQPQASLLAVEVTHLLQIWQGPVPCWSHHDPLMGQESEKVLGTWGFGKLKRGHSLGEREHKENVLKPKVPSSFIYLSKLNCTHKKHVWNKEVEIPAHIITCSLSQKC